MTEDTYPTIILSDASSAVSDVMQAAHDALQLIQRAATTMQLLQGEPAVSQTADVTSTRSLKAELEQLKLAETE